MKDFLEGRPVYRPLNGFTTAIRESENTALLPRLQPQSAVARPQPVEDPAPVRARATIPEPVHTATGSALGACRTGGSPEIELIQTDGRIEQIVVTCPCGERITLHCSY